MSYEGYSQLLCKNGHLWHLDCYEVDSKLEDNKCPTCGEQAVFEHMVDTTNDMGEPIELEIDKEEICDKCKSVLERTFKIPDVSNET